MQLNRIKFNINQASAGITLIETIVTIFIIFVGLSSIVTVAIFSSQAQKQTLQKITALSLAREGIEVTRVIRDTNWLPPNQPEHCPELGDQQFCYQGWLSNIPISTCENGCQAEFNPNTNSWRLIAAPGGNYALYQNEDSVFTPYGDPDQAAQYYRKIKIDKFNTDSPYTNEHPELRIVSVVAWIGQGCQPFGTDPDTALSRCKITLEDRLTNWKNY